MDKLCKIIPSPTHDIHDYLTSFNKEIQESGSSNSSEAEKSEDDELKKTDEPSTEEKFDDGLTYFTASDGTLYSAPTNELKEQIALMASSSDDGNALQHILLSVGDSNVQSSSELPIPVQLTNQLFSTQNVKDKSKSKDREQSSIKIKTEACEDVAKSTSEINAAPTTIMIVNTQDGNKGNQTSSSTVSGISSADLQNVKIVLNETQSDSNPVIVNADGQFQTVSILPTNANASEFSYVLLVSQAKDGNGNAVANDDTIEIADEIVDISDDEKVFKSIEENNGFKSVTIRLAEQPSHVLAQEHTCNYCEYSSSKRYLLSRHLKSHSDERPHKCSVCGRGFKTLASLHNHVNTHTGTRPHPCKECESSFTTSGELVRHVRYKHTHEKPHHCSECDYASVELSKLKRHMRCHTGERPYQCPNCTYASPDTYKLKRHMRIHTGEKPYMCNVCSARFTQSNSLKAHLLIHSGTKPVFQCDFCPTTCGRKTDLRIHMRKLHPRECAYHCKECNIFFQEQEPYDEHCKIHEEEQIAAEPYWINVHDVKSLDKVFVCEECDEAFMDKVDLRRHRSERHNIGYKSTVQEDSNNNGDNNTCADCNKTFSTKSLLLDHFQAYPNHRLSSNHESLQDEECTDVDNDNGNNNDNNNDDNNDTVMEGDEDKDVEPQVPVLEVFETATNDTNEDDPLDDQSLAETDSVTIVTVKKATQRKRKKDALQEVAAAIGITEEDKEVENIEEEPPQKVTKKRRCSERSKKSSILQPPVITKKTQPKRLVRILPKVAADAPIETKAKVLTKDDLPKKNKKTTAKRTTRPRRKN